MLAQSSALALPRVGAADEALCGFRRPALMATSQRLPPDRRRNAVSLRHTRRPLVLVAPADRCMARLRGRSSQTQAAIELAVWRRGSGDIVAGSRGLTDVRGSGR